MTYNLFTTDITWETSGVFFVVSNFLFLYFSFGISRSHFVETADNFNEGCVRMVCGIFGFIWLNFSCWDKGLGKLTVLSF
jgi:hypothetical protein